MREISIMLLVLLSFVITIFLGNEKQIQYLIDLSGSIIALVGILLAIPILKRKLIENHISKTLVDIQDGNKNLMSEITNIEDDCCYKACNNNLLEIEDLKSITEKVQYLYKISRDANSDSQTMLYLLKNTLLNIIHARNKENLFTEDIYGLILFVFSRVEFFTTQVIPIPNSTQLVMKELLNTKYKKWVTNSEFVNYKAFSKGVIYNPHSAHYLLFYNKINNISNLLIQKSAFLVFKNTAPLRKLLWGQKFYAPTKLKNKNYHPIFGNGTIYMISFDTIHYIDDDRYTVKIIYGNINDGMSFKDDYNSIEKLKMNYIDSYIENTEFSFDNVINMKNAEYECISVEFELEYLKKIFRKHKKQIKKSLMLK